MNLANYKTLIEINGSEPDILNAHVLYLQKENQLSDISEKLLENWQKNSDNTSLDILSALLKNADLDIIDDLLNQFDNKKLIKELQKQISESTEEFVSQFQAQDSSDQLFALMFVFNIVDFESKDKLLDLLQGLNIELFLSDPKLQELLEYSIQNYIQEFEEQKLRKNRLLKAFEFFSKLQEKAGKSVSDFYLSDFDKLIDRIMNNKIGNIELNFALSLIPSLAVHVAQSFDKFPQTVKQNLVDNVFPTLGDSPVGKLCSEIVEAKSSLKVNTPKESEKVPNEKLTKSENQLNTQIKEIEFKVKEIKKDLKQGKISSKEASKAIDDALDPIKPREVKVDVSKESAKAEIKHSNPLTELKVDGVTDANVSQNTKNIPNAKQADLETTQQK
ncbi:MAG: hypothetical protein ISQ32_00555 [Rickettsiales bacterium]|nr:hypothetical protein [Rickettsiales bacterium]